ncbi:hypothetical protein PIROE2DRAFT_42517 [Piromyces sp. E2]|nr:hypothetical protein PIROE2DRAFT_42517 [Piromyces sp. E2]|eukprot:OUM64486.1 hypothetical protein PIROE2DRAFT_42517 [Piromyces sp. E2]
MSSDTEDSKNEPSNIEKNESSDTIENDSSNTEKNESSNITENDSSNTENNENSRNNISVTFSQPNDTSITLQTSTNENSDIQSRQLKIEDRKKNESNFSLNADNPNNFFEDEIEENKVVYEIDFPPTEEEIRPKANHIKTTKYNIFTFLPLNLWSQFHRFSNIYFLLGALSTLCGYTVVSPVAQIMPLIIVLSVTAIKDAYGDIKRSSDDKKTNNEPYYILRNNEVKQVLCQDIFPGDVIVIQKGNKIPADCLLLSSSNDDGICYVETSDLDGETSLKKKTSLSELSCIRDLEGFSRIQGKIQCEPPSDKIKKNITNVSNMIRGNSSFVKIGSNMPNTSLPLNVNQMLFRGSVLRNTECVYLMAIYTGKETRVFRNSRQVGLKTSTLDPQLNKYLIYIFLLNFAILFISVVLQLFDSYKIIHKKRHYNHWYLHINGKWNTFTEFIKSILSFFALYTYFVPLSLFVTLEVVRVIQSWFFQWDHEMMEPKPTKQWVPMKVNSLNLGEDLGAIQYIFSDKTGTLTKNMMILTKWCIDGKIFDAFNEPSCLHQEIQNLYKKCDNPQNDDTTTTEKNEEFRDKILEYCRALATCHEVMISYDPTSYKPVYESQSPDETAIVIGLQKAGIRLISRTKDSIMFQLWNSEETHEILLLTEFTSDRKCMTVIVKRETNKGPVYTLYTKGADDIISKRLSTNKSVNNENVLTNTMNAIKLFGKMGYRVLMVAERIIDKDTFETFIDMYRKAECSLGNRVKNIAKALEYIEKDLILLGLTAVEDQLQDNIPETIDYLLNAGIKMWLLTGDQQDTAINIGMSSCLLNNNSNLMILNDKTYRRCERTLEKYINKMKENDEWGYPIDKKKNTEPYNPKDLTPLQRKFVEVGIRCRTVICCRVTPIQKANVVKAVRHNLKAVTLAIGDGANDVAMIQAAHVGVGIMGREGAQAVRASDYAFLEFRFLKPLLCVHGRYSYLQITKLILYSFYKNIVLSLVLFSYGFVSLWSGNTLLENYFLLSYNLFYTCFIILILACYERDIGIKAIYENPQLYKQVKDGIYWSNAKKFGWILSSIWHGLGKY